ncbi:MAG TPA: hypothetical protein DEG47_06285, partial [Cyanobacteria bacterium UBA11148]|nr:hypothetical protein [Cyanobacteria bacterium UBA11148]
MADSGLGMNGCFSLAVEMLRINTLKSTVCSCCWVGVVKTSGFDQKTSPRLHVSLNQLLLAPLVLGYWRFKSGERSPQQSGSTPFTSMISQFGEKIQTLSKKLHAASECFTS